MPRPNKLCVPTSTYNCILRETSLVDLRKLADHYSKQHRKQVSVADLIRFAVDTWLEQPKYPVDLDNQG